MAAHQAQFQAFQQQQMMAGQGQQQQQFVGAAMPIPMPGNGGMPVQQMQMQMGAPTGNYQPQFATAVAGGAGGMQYSAPPAYNTGAPAVNQGAY